MAGFDQGTQQGVIARTKQSGAILRGVNPPVPAIGVVGDLYVDVSRAWLYEKRADNLTSPWGRQLFEVPEPYVNTLKWFSSSKPSNVIGVDGDYCLCWGTYDGYGVSMRVWGPKTAGVWPDPITDVAVVINASFDALIVDGLRPGGAFQTGQVSKAAIQIFPTIPPASWPEFVTQYVGDETSTDDTYQTVFVTASAPINGQLWQLMDAYFQTTCGFTPVQSEQYLNDIWDLSATLPL